MKSIGTITKMAMALAVVALMYSCGGGAGKDPVKTAEQFAKANYAWDIDQARKLMGPFYEESELGESQDMIDNDKKMNKKIASAVSKHKYTIKYNKEDSTIEDDWARICFDTTVDFDKNEKESGWVELKKVDGVWYVEKDRLWVHEKTREKLFEIVFGSVGF